MAGLRWGREYRRCRGHAVEQVRTSCARVGINTTRQGGEDGAQGGFLTTDAQESVGMRTWLHRATPRGVKAWVTALRHHGDPVGANGKYPLAPKKYEVRLSQ